MHRSYEVLQGHSCMPFQDPSCKFISVLERICCSIKTGSQQFDLYRKCSVLLNSGVFVQYPLPRMLANLRDVKIPQPHFKKWKKKKKKSEEWSNYLYGEKKESHRQTESWQVAFPSHNKHDHFFAPILTCWWLEKPPHHGRMLPAALLPFHSTATMTLQKKDQTLSPYDYQSD